MPVRVLLVDDHEVVRRGLRDLLDTEEDVEVVGEAGGVNEALVRAEADRPDVAVVDMRLPDGDGLDLCRRLRAADAPPHCLVLTAFDDEQALVGAINAGASGYLLKQVRGQDLINAVREVAAGRSLLDPVTTRRVLDRLREGGGGEPDDDELRDLTEQEHRVLELIGEGLSNREIAERLFLAEKTVKNYVTSVLAKLGMERRTQAAAWYARHRG
ncbi:MULTISPECIES: response regulator [Actinopolyspora]|uniref:DNA-binding response regulator, NarL/FixJ family, contains REC and HTH domains n=1 Tax=Actinopolyspora saharensis TaxID=995062 RepID=A0A1H1FH74_9ACTN|nr:response regulator transcription factor [Actinopolyspora saharensis]NHD18811.1 response regulator transcription factor [Actinopolyspora sp. BKK2]NHE77234.1 response regulator transcription factor [Actinopolyspora sp. BKK1]SDR00148.1 DNA-binding response regulator, NarL/FixJ family, contains REC and HTH domains [Actinopolyspora saharensis]